MIYQTLIFDLGNVIIPLADENQWWKDTWCGIFNDPEKIHELRNQGFFIQYEKGDFDSNHFVNELQPFLKSDKSPEDIYTSWNQLLLEIPMHRIDFLRKLKEKYRIYLLSNTNPIHLDYIIDQLKTQHGKDLLADVFHECIYSYQFLEVKPDTSIYTKVLEKIEADASTTLFIDDKTANLEGAAKVGIQTFHITPQQDITEVLSHLL